MSRCNRSLKEDVILAPAAVVSVTVTRAGQSKNISARTCPAIVEIVTVSSAVQPSNCTGWRFTVGLVIVTVSRCDKSVYVANSV